MVLALGDYMGASCYACIGGTSIRSEVQKLQAEAPHIVVGTPGRVFDMLTRKNICKFIRNPESSGCHFLTNVCQLPDFYLYLTNEFLSR